MRGGHVPRGFGSSLGDRHRRLERVEVEQARGPAVGAREGGGDQAVEQRVGAVRAALELGMGLRPDPERVPRQLDELDEAAVRRRPRACQPVRFELAAVARAHLVAVAVALGDDGLAVERGDLRPRVEARDVRAEAHRAAHLDDVALLVHQVDDEVRAVRVELP